MVRDYSAKQIYLGTSLAVIQFARGQFGKKIINLAKTKLRKLLPNVWLIFLLYIQGDSAKCAQIKTHLSDL